MATTNKYDRQLRLWGTNGQKKVTETCVVLVRATTAGTETLKNLILPGIGSYVIVDDVNTDEDVFVDYPSNFFLQQPQENNNNDDEEVGEVRTTTTTTPKRRKCRAEIAYELLQELNPDVHGSWIHCTNGLVTFNYQSLLDTYKGQSIVVIGSDLEPQLIKQLATICDTNLVSYINILSYGLIGLVRIQSPIVPLMDTKPRTTTPDLRLLSPFPTLQSLFTKYCTELNWNELSNMDYGHIPYPYILYKVYKDWLLATNKDDNDESARLPETFAEKQEYQKLIRTTARNYDMDLNFQEAIKFAYLLYAPKVLDIEHYQSLLNTTQQVIGSTVTTSSSSSSSNPYTISLLKFHLLLKALLQFVNNRPETTRLYQPPINGSIPDMTASTTLYVELQKVYKDQAIADTNEIKLYLQQLVQQQPEYQPYQSVLDFTDDEIQTFCSNVHTLDVLQTGTVASEYNTTTATDSDIVESLLSTLEDLEDDSDEYASKQSPLLWYLGLRACQYFYETYGRYPGTNASNETDAIQLQECLTKLVSIQYPQLTQHTIIQQTLLSASEGSSSSDYCKELVRYGNAAEIHTIASIVGGVASQEIIKLITGQYVPINNTYIYNGIASIGAVYKF